jgi:hypothetical protein
MPCNGERRGAEANLQLQHLVGELHEDPKAIEASLLELLRLRPVAARHRTADTFFVRGD